MKRHQKDDEFALQFTGYRILTKSYREVEAIMAEFDQSENRLREALRIGHGIEIDDTIAGTAMLHIVLDQQMKEKLKEYRIDNPTLLQLIGTSRIISLSRKDAEERFAAMMREEN